MHVVCYAVVASDELNIFSVVILIYLIFSSNHEYHQHSQHQLQMGPKEPGDSYSGSGKAAGALGYPGNVCFIYNAVKKKSHLYALNQEENIYAKRLVWNC